MTPLSLIGETDFLSSFFSVRIVLHISDARIHKPLLMPWSKATPQEHCPLPSLLRKYTLS